MILWKRGVTERGAFANEALSLERQQRGWWPFSYRILKELEESYTPDDEPLLERLYQSLAAGDGIYKITKKGRFTDFDRELAEKAAAHFPTSQEIVVHDMGVSSGVTSLELYREMQQRRSVQMIASDYYDHLTLVDVPGTILRHQVWTVAFDTENRPIQTTGLGTVFGFKPYPWRYAFVRLAQKWVDRHVRLFHPEVIQAAKTDPAFRIVHHDVFSPNPYPCHIVRAMNVITPKHFSREQTQSAIRASVHHLLPGGWLVLGRSIDEEDGRLRATVYQQQDGRLFPLWDYQGGYEWPELVSELQLDLPATTGGAP